RVNQDNSPRIHRNAGYENQRNGNVVGAWENVGSSVVQKSRIQCYNCKEFRHVARECQKPKKAKDATYHKEKMLLCKQEEARIQLNAEQADWRNDTDDDELEDQELEVSNDDHYNVFVLESVNHEQSKHVHDTYPIEQDAQPMIIDSLDMSNDREEIDQNDDDNDLAKERELLASLIEKLKCEIDESKNLNQFLETSNKYDEDADLAEERELLASLIEKLKCEIDESKKRNTFLETSNKVLVEKLTSELEDFRNKNKSLTEANNKLSKENDLLYADFKKSKAELKRRDSIGTRFRNDNMYEDEDFGIFGNIFESAKFAEFETLTNERDSQDDLPRKSSRKTTLPRKLGDYVLDNKVKYDIDNFVNYTHLSKDNFVFSTSLNKIIEPKTYLEAISDHRWIEAMNPEMEALNMNNTWILTDVVATWAELHTWKYSSKFQYFNC
nr:ribonuclease H-like domain-containing protein [Tanacetum cinerariifolium]